MESRSWSEAITIGDLLLRTAARVPDADAAVFPDRRVSYAELATEARRIARGLIGAGVRPGDRVGYLMANSPQVMATLYGIALAGAVIVPINTRYRSRELPFVVADAGITTIVTHDLIDDYVDLLGLLHEALPGVAEAPDPHALALDVAPDLRSIVVLGSRRAPGTLDEAAFAALADGVSEAELDRRREGVAVGSLALLLFTSGTTSQPRAARLSHEALVRNWTTFGRVFRMEDEGERVWAPCPMFHLGCIGPMLMCAAFGAALISDTWFRPDRAVELLGAERPTILYPAYPPITQGVLTHPRYGELDLSTARVILNVGPPDLLRQIEAAVPSATLVSIYALTESGGAVTLTDLDDDLETRVTTMGTVLPGTEVRIADPDTGETLPDGQTGEICVRGISVCDGYHNDPEKNARTIDAEGWLHTGDRGRWNPDGRLIFEGRLKEMLKVGGENVAAVEIEAHISGHPAVKLVQVVGVPDERLWEVPVAFVELKPGAAVSEQEIIDHCTGAIASFKVPRHVLFTDTWPMSASKIKKFELVAQAVERLGLEVPAPA